MAGSLREQIREYRIEKEKRYEQFRDMLVRAAAAGDEAAGAVSARSRRRGGAVWVQLADGRSSFRRFLAEEHVPGWRRGNRRMGVYFAVDFPDFGQSMAYAVAFADVLASGGVEVTVEHQVITAGDD